MTFEWHSSVVVISNIPSQYDLIKIPKLNPPAAVAAAAKFDMQQQILHSTKLKNLYPGPSRTDLSPLRPLGINQVAAEGTV